MSLSPVPSDESLRLVFTGSPLPMWLHDPATRAILDVNAAAVAHYGYSRDEFLNMRVDDMCAEGNRERHRLRDGREVDVEVAAHTLHFGGRPVTLAVIHDVTSRKRAEEDLRRLNGELEERVRLRTSQLQAVVDELEAFSYSVSHDLRAPLRSIAGFSQALLEDAGLSLPAGAKDDVDRICAATKRMEYLIDDLLSLSMVSRAEMTREPVDVTELAGRIVAELRSQSPARTVILRIVPGMTASGDPRLLRVALENLLTNAWKFTSRREQARIEVGQTSRGGSGVAFFVRDNGVGFDPTYADRLFGPFQRLHDASDFPGTGIGLATVRRIVQRHGGHVWAEGQMAQGACFYFTLQ